MEFLEVIEASAIAMWIKESSTTYVTVLAFHTIGLAFLVGISGAMSMRILGVARTMPLAPMQDLFPLMFVGAAMNVVTGVILLGLYPTDYLIDPTLYLKLSAVAVAVVVLRKMRFALFEGGNNPETVAEEPRVQRMAVILLSAWLLATVCGRVMAYTMPTKLQTLAATLVFLFIGWLVVRFAGDRLGLTHATSQAQEQRPEAGA